MIRLTFIFALLLFSAFSCSKEEESTAPVNPLEEIPAYVSRVNAPATATVGVFTPIEVYFVVNDGCGYFGSFETEGTGTEQTIKVYAKYRPNICTQALVTLKQTYEFKPVVAGTYTLRFYQEPEKYITKTIVVSNSN
ncbi:hypothetical protein WG947_10260 [Pontibacter sp. H259]|uniref:hypothetical protein n=1 Tax=Pontibacter sp. H259 TaxID=3133421 RepID=UPI0030BF2317